MTSRGSRQVSCNHHHRDRPRSSEQFAAHDAFAACRGIAAYEFAITMTTSPPKDDAVPDVAPDAAAVESSQRTLKYSLLGPSLLKAGQDKVDQSKARSSFI